VKYAYLPQHLQPGIDRGQRDGRDGTFVAIPIGTILGGQLAGIPEAGPAWVAAATTPSPSPDGSPSRSCRRPPGSGARDQLNPFSDVEKPEARQGNRTVFLSLGISWLCLRRNGSSRRSSISRKTCLAATERRDDAARGLSIGVGTGSLLCERMSAQGRDRPVPFGSIG
jgi:hypothetical protein